MRIVNHHAGCCGYLPIKSDGTHWPHVYGLPGGGSVHADSAAEILAELLPGYDDLDAAGARQARIRHALVAASQAQDVHLARAAGRGFDERDPADAALAQALRLDKGAPMSLASPDRPGEAVPWEGAVPLVLVTTAYAPHTDAPRPGGNIVWIDPDTEQGYLDSLRDSEAFDYWRERELV